MPDPTPASPASDKPAVAAPEETPGAPPVQDITDVYKDFDAAEQAESRPAPPPSKKESGKNPPTAPAKPAATPSAKAGAEDTPKTAKDTSASSAGSEDGKDRKFENLTDEQYAKLDKPARVAYNASLRQQNSRLEEQLRSVRSEVETLKKAPQDTGRVKELETLLDQRNARLKEMEEHLKLTAYEKSEEFKEQFQKPYTQAYTMGRNKAASIKLVERRDNDGNVTQAVRQGTAEDFDAIMRVSDDDAAYEMAERMFGPKAQAVMHYRERAQELHAASRQAIEDRRAKSESIEKETLESQKRQAEETEARTKANAAAFRTAVDAGLKAHPEWYEAPEGDEGAQAAVEAGKAMANALVTGINPKTGKPYTQEGLTRFHAFVHNVIAAHGPILHQLKAAKARIGDLEAQLSEFKESATLEDAGRTGERATGTELPGREEFEEADRVGR